MTNSCDFDLFVLILCAAEKFGPNMKKIVSFGLVQTKEFNSGETAEVLSSTASIQRSLQNSSFNTNATNDDNNNDSDSNSNNNTGGIKIKSIY